MTDKTSPIFEGRDGLPITPEQDRMLEIKWAEYWATEGDMWGVQVHGTSTAEVIDGFYFWKSANPDVPNWWFPRDLMNKKQLEQKAFVGWGITQEQIDDLKEAFEKGIFDIEKDKELLRGINELDGSSMLMNIDTPTNAAMKEVSKEELEKALRFVYRRHKKEPGILHKSLFLDELALGLQAEVGLTKIDSEEFVDNFFHKYKDTKLFKEKFKFANLAEAGIDVTKATIGEELAEVTRRGAEFANKAMTDKQRIEYLLKSINKEFPDRIKLGNRLKEVYKILAMDKLELLTLDQYRGQNMDFVLEQLQKEGLELGDTIRELDKEITKKYNVKVTDLQSDLALLNQFDVVDMKDLPKEITQGMSIEPRNKPPEADYYNKLFEEIAEQNPIDEPDITLNPDGSTTEIVEGSYTDDLGIEYKSRQEINRDVPIEEFKTMFSGSPADHPMPKILDDLKGTDVYDSARFQLWSLELEYQDRQKFKKIVERQYEIFYEFLKENPNLSIENKKELLEEVRKRTLMLDEKYKKFTVKNDVDLSLQELTTFDNELDDINKNFKRKLETALDNIKLDLPNDLNRDIRYLQIDELALSDEYKKYIKEIMKDTDTILSPEIIRKLDNALATTSGKDAVETMILNLRNGVTKHGSYSLDNLLNDYGANYFDIKGAKQEIAQIYYSRIDEILESHLNPNAFNPDLEMKIQFEFAESKLRELGVSDSKIEDALKNNKFFQTGRAFTDPEMRKELDKLLQENDGPNIIDFEKETTGTDAFDEIVSNIDEPLDQNVIDFREKQLEKLIQEVEDATPNVEMITPEQAAKIDEALDDMVAQELRGNFEAIPGGKGKVLSLLKRRLVNIFAGGLTLLDVYEIALIGGAIGQPAIDPIIKLIFPDTPDDDRPYKEKVYENLIRIEEISPTAKAMKKYKEKMPDEQRKYNTFGVPENYSANFSPFYGILGGYEDDGRK